MVHDKPSSLLDTNAFLYRRTGQRNLAPQLPIPCRIWVAEGLNKIEKHSNRICDGQKLNSTQKKKTPTVGKRKEKICSVKF